MVLDMHRYRFFLAAFVFAVLLGLLAQIASGFGGPAWLGYKGLGWTVARSLIVAPIAVALALVLWTKTKRKS